MKANKFKKTLKKHKNRQIHGEVQIAEQRIIKKQEEKPERGLKIDQKPLQVQNQKADKRLHQEKKTLFENLLFIICKPNMIAHLVIASSAVALGLILNTFDEMPLFWLKGLFGFSLYMILVYSIKYLKNKNKKIKLELTGDPKLANCQTKYTKRINSNINYILCFFACIYFIIISIVLGFVQMNLIGIYSLIGLFCVVFFAFIVFQQYINILFLLYDISKISPGKYFELLPERTKWFNLLETLSNVYRNMFIILGSLFILLFILFSPVNSIQIIFQGKCSYAQYIPLLFTWIIILLAIVFMVPCSSFIRYHLLHKIYNNLSKQSIMNYNYLYEISEIDNKQIYIELILRLNDRKYMLSNSFAWVIPTIVSITNFSSVIISVVADLKEIGLIT